MRPAACSNDPDRDRMFVRPPLDDYDQAKVADLLAQAEGTRLKNIGGILGPEPPKGYQHSDYRRKKR